jgi:hypothetical protein
LFGSQREFLKKKSVLFYLIAKGGSPVSGLLVIEIACGAENGYI